MLLLSALLTVGLVHCFNLSPQHALLIADPRRRDADTYFGYSVALQRDDKQYRVIVGAPQADSGVAAHETQHRPGVVYSCTAAHGCKQLVLDQSGGLHNRRYKNQVLNERRSGAWIGGALDVLDEGGGVLVCGPRWRNEDSGHFLMNGICYLKNSETEEAGKLLPLITRARQALHNDTFYYAYGEAGVSTHLHKDGLELLIGAPGVLEWAGTVIRYRFKRHLSVRAEYTRNIPRPNTDDIGYFGYAVSSGQFRHNYTYYVGGAPRGSDMRGTVLVFDYRSKDDDYIDVVVQLNGTQVGEYFGAVVCVVDVNGDGLDDLLVGAPLYSLPGREGDEGRVYVYVNREGTLSTTATAMLMGNSSAGGRFGSAIADLGDLNHDGYRDFAIGAPYEDAGRGAVYVYHGRRDGLMAAQYSQRISAQDIGQGTPITGFGISISRGLDIDGNHYNDVAVGAYTSGHVAVLRSSPVVSLRARLGDNLRHLAVYATEAVVDACLLYDGKHAPPSVDVRVALRVSGRALFVDGVHNMSYTTSLRHGVEDCRPVAVSIVLHPSGDLLHPIEFSMHYEIDASAARWPHDARGFCAACPVADPGASSDVRRLVMIASGCGDVCLTDLTVTTTLPNTALILGLNSSVVLHVAVRNSGEPAYRVRVSVRLPQGAPLLRLPATCREVEVDDELECDLANPLHADEEVTLELQVNLARVASIADLVFTVDASSDGDEQTPADNTHALTLRLRAVADLRITGFSSQPQGALTSNQSFMQTFRVTNHGPSPVSELQLDFLFPVTLATASGVVTFMKVVQEVEPDRPHLECHLMDVSAATPSTVVRVAAPEERTLHVQCPDAGGVACMCLHCDAGPVAAAAAMEVAFRLSVDIDKLDSARSRKDIIAVTSSARVVTDQVLLATTTALLHAGVPQEHISWTWLGLAVGGGLLILLVLIALLHQLGFFRRKKREDLDAMSEQDNVPVSSTEPAACVSTRHHCILE